MDTSRHAGRTALVTGAGAGIGRATVLRLLQEGAEVIGLDLSAERFDAVREEAGSDGSRLTWAVADVADAEAVVDVFAAVPRLDILVNNAGIMDHFVPLGEMDDELWRRVMGVNVDGVMYMTRAALTVMERQGAGSIVVVSSKGGHSGGVSGCAYAASKHAVIGLVRHVAFFYGPKGIRCNAVAPGGVATEIAGTAMPHSQWALERAGAALAAMTAPVPPDQIAAPISWLASDEAADVNGSVLNADGGWSAA